MKIKRFFSPAFLSFQMLAALGCQTAKKPSPAVPPVPVATPSIQASPRKPSDKPGAAAPAVNTTAKPSPVPPGPRPDPTQELLTLVDREYQAGLDDSKAGRNRPAEEHFERALGLLEGSPPAMRSDPRFAREYKRVLESRNQQPPTGPER